MTCGDSSCIATCRPCREDINRFTWASVVSDVDDANRG